MSHRDHGSLLSLRVVADADPAAIARVLERFQNLNVIPRRVAAELGSDNTLHIEVVVLGLPRAQMELIAAKVRESVSVSHAYWYSV